MLRKTDITIGSEDFGENLWKINEIRIALFLSKTLNQNQNNFVTKNNIFHSLGDDCKSVLSVRN